MGNFKKQLHNTPIWLINLISVASGIVTILSPIVGVIVAIITGEKIKIATTIAFVTLFAFMCILFFRMKKYRQLAIKRMRVTSEKFHKLSHESRNVFFDTLHSYKVNSLTCNELNSMYQAYISKVLDNLCEVINSFTEREICACVKLFSYTEDEEVIDENDSQLVTFCRSNNSDTDRDNYEKHKTKPIFMRDNTDFREIIDCEQDKDYFYKGNLAEYKKELEKIGKTYRNTNENWSKYYRGTIVVPIRIEFKRLYHQKKNDSYHIIGFLCVDSMSTDAFTEEQENYNVDIVKSYADIIYLLLSQYKHYMKKFQSVVSNSTQFT